MSELEGRLPPVLENLNTGIALHDPETGTILDANGELEALYGYSKAEFRQMTLADFTGASAGASAEDALHKVQTASTGSSQTLTFQVERRNGEYRWTRVDFTQTTIDGEQYVLGEVTDVTEYKVREQLLRLLNRVIRHNLRNDMNILIGYADKAKTAIENDAIDDEIDTILDIATEVGSLSESLDQIERVFRPDATEREPTNLRTVVQTCAKEVQTDNPSAEVTVEAPFGVWVVADQGLRYAIDNALKNAIEHNDQNTPEVTVTIVDDPENGYGQVRIADNGPPIPDVEIDVLDNQTNVNSTYHGSGVGLWVMKWCVDSLGGELTFEENSPRGNIVEISVPKVRHSSSRT